MKKLFYAAAIAATVFTVAGANAQGPDPKGNFNRNDDAILNYYRDGRIQDVKHSMLLTENQWWVKHRKHKEIWNTQNTAARDVTVKFKSKGDKSFVKAKTVGDGKEFLKDYNPVKNDKHIAKIREDGKVYRMKNVAYEDGAEIVLNAKNK